MVIPGRCASTGPQMRNCASGNLEIPGSRSRAPRNDCSYRDRAIEAPRNWLSARITIDCLAPEVRSVMLALKPAALATTSKLPPAPRPCSVPAMLRLLSFQLPVIAPPS
jgi:hypothetical protein